jgi:hypothetical protein
VCKLEIEQGYNRIEFEFKSIYQATEVIEFLKDGVKKETKFIVTDETDVEKKGVKNEIIRY